MAGGDGGYAASDPTDPNYFYGEFQWLSRAPQLGRRGVVEHVLR